jgi:hypothetical protein
VDRITFFRALLRKQRRRRKRKCRQKDRSTIAEFDGKSEFGFSTGGTSMARFNNPLDKVRVAAPCNADWDAMIGNDRSRFCGQCSLNVYNLSSMTRSEAESLIARSERRLCVRFYRRADGSILTENCPVGLRALRRRVSSLSKAIASAVLSFFAGLGVYEGLSALSILDPPPRYQTVGVMVAPRSLPVLPATPASGTTLPFEIGKMRVTKKVDLIPAEISSRPKRVSR